MSLVADSGRDSCAPSDWTPQTTRRAPTIAATRVTVRRRFKNSIIMADTPLAFISSATGDHVLWLDRRGLVPPAGALVAEDRRDLLVAELIGEGRHGRGVRDAADGLAREPMQHGAEMLGRIGRRHDSAPLERREHARKPLPAQLMARRALVPEYLLTERRPRRLAGGPGAAGGGRRRARRRRGGRRRAVRSVLGGHVPHAPRHDDEKQHPRPRRNRRGRLGPRRLERVTWSTREGVDEEWKPPTDRLAGRQADHRDARPVANGERNLFDAYETGVVDGAHAQAMRAVRQARGIELERCRRFKRLPRSGLVVDEDLDPHGCRASRGSSMSSSRMRRLMWRGSVSRGLTV